MSFLGGGKKAAQQSSSQTVSEIRDAFKDAQEARTPEQFDTAVQRAGEAQQRYFKERG